MKALRGVALSCAVALALGGCRNGKPEPIPPPKAGSAHPMPPSPGIAWFQGNLEEAFARTVLRHRPMGRNQAAPRQWEPGCNGAEKG